MVKIFLTGDNHIGLKYVSHKKPDILQEKRFTAFEGMVDAANREDCDLFVVAGDLFNSTTDSIRKKDIKRLLDMMSCFKGTVVVLPGNHDYYGKEASVWLHFEELLASYDNILLLTEYKPYSLACGESKVIMYPALCQSRNSESGFNNLEWIKKEHIPANDADYHIGIAHGAVEGETIDRESTYFLMKREELEKIPVDVWLIGHTHVPFPRTLSETDYAAGERIFNAGTHVQIDVSCNTDGECFIIEIDERKTVRAKKYHSGNICFCRKQVKFEPGKLEYRLNEALDGLEDDSVVDIILFGTLLAEEYENRKQIIESALDRFIEGTYNDAALSRQITKEQIDSEFTETSFAAGMLHALLDNPKETQLAYELLQSLKGVK